jgi:hypothetical protein
MCCMCSHQHSKPNASNGWQQGIQTHCGQLQSCGVHMPIAAQVRGTRGFQATAESKLQKKMCKVMTDNTQEFCMGEKWSICEQDGIKLHTLVQYSPELNGVAEHTIGHAHCAT